MARLTVGCKQELGNIQRLPFDPGLKRRSRQDVIQQHRQLEALFLREKSVHLENAQLGKRRRLGLQDQFTQVQISTFLPGVFENIGEQDVLARAHWIDILQPDQSQQGGHGAGDLLAQHLAIALPWHLGRL